VFVEPSVGQGQLDGRWNPSGKSVSLLPQAELIWYEVRAWNEVMDADTA
jgi:hypothetical protein